MKQLRVCRWFPLYLVVLLAATLSPLWLLCVPQSLGIRFNPIDLVLNVAIFVPFGLALVRYPVTTVVAAALTLSGLIELIQCWLPRHPSWLDILTNGTGALLGWRFADAIRWRARNALSAPVLLAATALLLALVFVFRPALKSNDFSNWEPFSLALGDEVTADRTWRGTIAELAIYDHVLRQDPPTNAGEPLPWARGGPILRLRFEAPVAGRVDGPEGPKQLLLQPPQESAVRLSADGLHLEGGVWLLDQAVADHVHERLGATNQLSLLARLRVADLTSGGPARIVTLSADTRRRNFTLGQTRRDLVLRLRTPNTTINGNPAVKTLDQPLASGFHDIRASFDGQVGKIFVDGRCRGSLLYAQYYAQGVLAPGILPLTIVAQTVLAALAAGALVGGSIRRRRVAFLAGGGAAFGILRVAGVWSPMPAFDLIGGLVAVAALVSALPLLANRDPSDHPRADASD
jgi:hypothetical protein